MLADWIKSTLSSFLTFWRGEKDEFSLEGKIFHVFSLLVISSSFCASIFNLFLDLYAPALITIAIFFLHSFVYYISRFKKKINTGVVLSIIEGNVFLSLNYFYNSGISGPTLLLFVTTFFLLLTVVSRKYTYWVLLANLTTVSGVIAINYYNPMWGSNVYESKSSHFFDVYFTYALSIVLIYIGTSYLRNSYYKKKNESSEKAKDLEVLNSEKDKLFSIISHDLRTPLANVQQYLELLSYEDMAAEEKEVLERELLNITRNAQELLTNLLAWSRNQMNGVNIQWQNFNLYEEVSKTIAHMGMLSKKKNIQLKTNIDKDIEIVADIDMVNLILRNLMHNAIKFTPIGGTVEIDASVNHDKCIISVKDNGNGISENRKDQIFSLKTKSTIGTGKEKGTGIGLMLCKEYVQLLGGKIWFKSKEKEGTVFFFSIPKMKAVSA